MRGEAVLCVSKNTSISSSSSCILVVVSCILDAVSGSCSSILAVSSSCDDSSCGVSDVAACES